VSIMSPAAAMAHPRPMIRLPYRATSGRPSSAATENVTPIGANARPARNGVSPNPPCSSKVSVNMKLAK